MKSTKYAIGSLMILAMASIGLSAHAEEGRPQLPKKRPEMMRVATSTGSTTRQNIRDAREDFREDRREDRAAFKASSTEDRKDFREERREDRKDFRASTTEMRKDARRGKVEDQIKKRGDHMIEMFNAAVARLEKIATRIDSRIAKLKTEGKNTSEAESAVASARASIVTVKADIALLPGAITTALGQTELKGAFKDVEVLAKKVRDDIKVVHGFLETAIKSVKGLGDVASTTPKIKSEVE